ncbi:MAG: ABC transporter substrate-binding protein [Armatimonadota bacterium]|nr:ABC transporter substrate-binding protein [Armatimonadota bacterium]MDR7485656.1 ABC transporter substrate-binding protein [Armatimonadota bacterium]MDR7534307.1 ABC transporter substrate-binding protein [Armatimonadota bacterium]MDR7535919.1 ABC transporter substrate-binding protein [Armatimonadota bacterium]
MRSSHQRLPRRAVAIAVAVLLAAALAPTELGAQGQPARTLRVAIVSDVNTLDPHMTATVQTDLSVISHIYTSLVVRGPDLALRPAAATSWRVVSDTVWRFTLREDIRFENGERLNAQVVKWNIDRVRAPETRARIRPWFELVEEVRVVDGRTVDIVTKAPYPALADQLSMFFLLPPDWASKNNPAAQAMGSGPYRLREWVRDDRIVLEASPSYWGQRPPFQTLIFRAIPEASTRVAALLAGDVDIITGVAPTDFGRLSGNPATQVGATPSIRSAFVKLNTLRKPLDDVRVRQALNYAVDKDALVRNLLGNLTTKSNCQVLTPAYFGYNEDLRPYPYDPARARALLQEAGLAGGFETEFDVPVGVYLLGEVLSQAITRQLEQVGVRARITEMPFSVYMNKYLPQQNLAPMSYLTQAWPTVDADGLLSLFEAGNQYAYWNDTQFRDLLVAARSTHNRARRLALYKQATERMCQQAPVIFLFPQPATYAVRRTLDWKARPDDWVRAMDVRLR